MRRVLIVVVLIVAAAVLGLWRSHGGVRQGLSRAVGMPDETAQGEVRDEIRKSFQLQPGDRIDVQGINGAVTIETSDTKTAEVYVLRTARSSDGLTRREITIEETPTGLQVRSRQARHVGIWEHLFGSKPNEQVTIKAPRQIALSIRGVNGHVTTGDIDGSLEAKGINGRVELGQANDFAEIGGINGNITLGLKQLSERGARLNGMNGSVRSDIPEVTVEKDQYAPRYSARIGNGGAPIAISGINGNVRLTRAEGSTANSDSTGTKQSAANQKVEKSPSESKTFKGEQ